MVPSTVFSMNTGCSDIKSDNLNGGIIVQEKKAFKEGQCQHSFEFFILWILILFLGHFKRFLSAMYPQLF